MKKINENGASMVEVLGVLAIIGMISAGMFSGIASIQSKIKIQQAHTQISDIVKGMREQFSSFLPRTDTGVISPSKLQKAGVLKARDIDESADKAVHVFGDSMTIKHVQKEDDDPYFSLTLENIPTQVCVELLMSDWGSDPSSGLQAIKVSSGSKGFYWKKNKPNCKTEEHCLPPSLETAAEECSTKDTVNLIWHYYY